MRRKTTAVKNKPLTRGQKKKLKHSRKIDLRGAMNDPLMDWSKFRHPIVHLRRR